MLKIFVFLCIVYLSYRVLVYFVKRKIIQKIKKVQEEQYKPEAKPATDMVKDPICGAYMPTTIAFPLKKDGVQYWFCSTKCKDSFLKQYNL